MVPGARPKPDLDARGLPRGYPARPDWEATPREVKAMLDGHESLVLIDCRTPGEHHIANIAGAKLVPLHEVAARLPELEKQKEQKVVVYCHHGARSLQMTSFLRQRGFKDVRSMAGGIDLWSIDVDPTVARY